MLNNIWFIAAIWMGLALVGSLISIWTGISVALVEILVGVAAGNIALGFEGGTLQIGIAGGNIDAGQLHHVLQSTEWKTSWPCSAPACSHFLRALKLIRTRLKPI